MSFRIAPPAILFHVFLRLNNIKPTVTNRTDVHAQTSKLALRTKPTMVVLARTVRTMFINKNAPRFPLSPFLPEYHLFPFIVSFLLSYLAPQHVWTIFEVTVYGSMLLAGRRSSKYPLPSFLVSVGILMEAPRSATPYLSRFVGQQSEYTTRSDLDILLRISKNTNIH
jgi:hypothetical protein